MVGIPQRHFQTSALPVEARFEIWRDRMGAMFDIDTIDGRRDLRVDVRSFNLGGMIFSNMEVDPFVFERSARKVRADMLDHVMLRFDAPAHAGQKPRMLTMDLGQPLERAPISTRNLSVILPRATMAGLVRQPERLHGQFVEGGSITLLYEYLRALSTSIGSIDAGQVSGILSATEGLIAACVGGLQGGPAKARAGGKATALMRARRHVEAHLADPALNPEGIAGACSISRSSLYRLFADHGGVAGYVQERRLVRAFAMLSNPSNTSTIAMTAHRCGFSSDAYFSRAFKQRFGCSPSELRADALSGARAHRLGERNQAMADNVFKAWVSGLSG
ncbi:hypothetical protein A6B37_11230 [Achromobacter sp. HZ01]|nr:hypothetical protein A6B37_11230 [Achromobacter sp. HZ01]